MSALNASQKEPIALIGMACIFPQAPDVGTYWRNILAGIDAVGDPVSEWDAGRYLQSGRINTPRGGYLKELYRFEPKEFGIMPASLDGGEPDQFLALRVARDALADAGCLHDYDHSETGIVLGHSTYLHRGQVNLIQHNIMLDQTVELLRAVLPSLDEEALLRARAFLEKKLPPFTADIVPGLVPNVMTGRIANRLNLKGPNYLIDAACASSLLAVGAAMDELRNGRSRIMLAGGVNASLPAEVSVIFTQLGALSERGRVRPFEAGSDGTLLGEGLGVVVLKRAADALADGDRIYAVVLGVGQSSDGRGHSLLAPSVEGEALAIERAYRVSGVDPGTIGLVEAHGTGIPLGDRTEIAALKKILGARKGAQGSIAMGSVKSMISHCIPAAGIAGLIKSALALHHKILPPTLCGTLNEELGIGETPLYINTTAKPWISRPGDPRRAGVNSFGFGGVNAHAVLEEAPRQARRPSLLTVRPAELCVFSAESDAALADALQQAARRLREDAGCAVGAVAAALAASDRALPHRLAIVANDAEDLRRKIGQALKRIQDDAGVRWSSRNGICYSRAPLAGTVAFLFPGEGSQYLQMFADLALHFEEVRTWFDFWRGLYPDAPGETRTDIVFPPESEMTGQRRAELEQRLHAMDVGSEAVFIGSQAMYSLLTSLGVRPDVMVGHSTGESSALVASGAIDAGDAAELAGFIRELNAVYRRVLGEGKIPTGALLTVGALPQATVEEQVAALHGRAAVAMENCENQLVLYGDAASIGELQNALNAAGGITVHLPFDRGYHTRHFSAVSDAFRGYYESIGLKAPRVPLYSCASAGLFPQDAREVRELAAGQWSNKVRFRETVIKMAEEGVRFFVEVGPSGNLSAFIHDIPVGEECLALPTNLRRKNGVEQLLVALSHLYVNGKELQVGRLFGSRPPGGAEQERAVQSKQPGILLDNTMPLLRLGGSDPAAFQELLALPAAAYRGEPQPGGMPASTVTAPSSDAHEGPEPDGQSEPDGMVMAGHFALMRGFLEQQRAVLEQWGVCGPAGGESSGAPEEQPVPTPFLTWIREAGEGKVEGECRLSVREDAFLRDHVLSGAVSGYDPALLGLPCVPLTVSLEIMAEACALLAGSTAVRSIDNVKAFGWIALDDGALTLTVGAEALGQDGAAFRAHLISSGSVAVSADFSFDTAWKLRGMPELADRRPSRWEGRELYTIGMFHGPLFQSIRRIDAWSGEGIDARLSEVGLAGFFAEDEMPELVLNPVLLDAMGQLTAYWIAQQVGTDFNCFPSAIERIELYRQCPHNVGGLTLRARQEPLDPAAAAAEAARAWHFECLDSEGHPVFRAANLTNIYFPVPHSFYEVRRDPLNGWLGHPAKTIGKGEALLWQLPHFSEKFCVQSGAIFLRILAHAVLTADERAEWGTLPANVRRRREWLFGRACIKEAVRFWIREQTGALLHPADIAVLHDEYGAPYVDGAWSAAVAPPEVSLSHDRHLSLAAVTAPRRRVGVDMEHMGRIREPGLLKGSLTPDELQALHRFSGSAQPEKALRIWCAKEAAAKYLGVGLQGSPESFAVAFVDDSWEVARIRHAGQVIEAYVRCEEDLIVALATRSAHSIDGEVRQWR
ncbi:MAG: beta-ketoacyl synthase N-terminal-like domain-containing protein [Thermodesulfovibrionales bacterium]